MEENSELMQKLKAILLKKAEGYFYDEKTEEFQTDDGEKAIAQLRFDLGEQKPAKKRSTLKRTKMKVTSKYVPPDLAAIKMLIDIYGEQSSSLASLSDQELFKLRDKLIEELNNIKEDKK